MHTSARHADTLRRFTLIELLVVVSIIAILASILLPALVSARKRGEATLCVGNQKQVLTGYAIYADEMDDYIPNARYYSDGWQAKIGSTGVWGAPTKLWRVHQDFKNMYYSDSYPILECPSEEPYYQGVGGKAAGGHYNRYTHNYYRSSFSQNWSLVRYGYTTPRRGYSTGPRAAAFKKGTDEADISADCMLNTSGLSYYTWGIDTFNIYSAHAFRHPGERATVGYWDGHAALVGSKWNTGKSLFNMLFDDNP